MTNASTGIVYYEMPQEFSNLTSWDCLQSILLSSSSIHALAEGYSAPGAVGVNTSAMTFLCDFELSASGGIPSRTGMVTYSPTSEYRIVVLRAGGALLVVDIQAYFLTKQGQLIPLTLPPGSSMNAKILLRSKDWRI